MSIDHQKYVLAGIIPDRKDLLLYAVQHLNEEHFTNAIQKGIFKMLDRYYEIAGGILPKKVLADQLARSESIETTKALLYEEVYTEVENLEIADHEFRYAVDALKDERAKQMTGEAIATSYEILLRGYEVDHEKMEGHKDARAYVYSRLAEIDALDNIETSPEGDMRHEGDEILQEYADKRDGKVEPGVLTGIGAIDKATGGFSRGELGVVAAYTNAGKTQFCCQTAWNAGVVQGKNVFFATSETVRPTVRRRIVARHSRLPQFGLAKGLDTTDIKNGTLSAEEEKVLKDVVHDLNTNPKYGKIYIIQIPKGATLSYLEARMNRQGANWQIDLALMDYLALLKSDRRRNSEREEMNEIIKDTKVYATSFADGMGVPFITPWQIKRDAYTEALRTGAYGLSALADTSEIEKSADQVISLLNMPEKKGHVSLQFLKMRDGEIPHAFTLETDFRNAYLVDPKKATGFTGTTSGPGVGGYLDL